MKYSDWISCWARHLISLTSHKIFTICKYSMLFNLELAQFMLPHIILHFITEKKKIGTSNDWINLILSDFNLSLAMFLSELFLTCRFHLQRSHERSECLRWQEECAQPRADLMHETDFACFRIPQTPRKVRIRLIELEFDRLHCLISSHMSDELLMKKIPKRVLAEACFRCHSYMRAIMVWILSERVKFRPNFVNSPYSLFDWLS